MNEYLTQYIETALWSSNDESTPEGGEPMDKNYGVDDLAPETLKLMQADLDRFEKAAGEMLEEDPGSIEGYVQIWPHDFWLTRNGHGAGFWDGDWPINGDKLTAMVGGADFPEIDLYVGDDGKIYQC